MNRALWIAKKNELCFLIKKVSDYHGGDDLEWLREYCRQVVEKFKDDIDYPIHVFTIVLDGLNLGQDWYKKLYELPATKRAGCPICNYVKPFCRCST